MKFCLLSAALILLVGCTPGDTTEQPERQPVESETRKILLKEDLGASDFKMALIGRWVSVFTYKGKRNLQNLEFMPGGNASLLITRDDESQQHSGPYSVSFDREPIEGAVTFATITVTPEGADPIVLSRANFGLHNGIPLQQGVVLRIDSEPHGVLKKTN
jgi:hypothetical protein